MGKGTSQHREQWPCPAVSLVPSNMVEASRKDVPSTPSLQEDDLVRLIFMLPGATIIWGSFPSLVLQLAKDFVNLWYILNKFPFLALAGLGYLSVTCNAQNSNWCPYEASQPLFSHASPLSLPSFPNSAQMTWSPHCLFSHRWRFLPYFPSYATKLITGCLRLDTTGHPSDHDSSFLQPGVRLPWPTALAAHHKGAVDEALPLWPTRLPSQRWLHSHLFQIWLPSGCAPLTWWGAGARMLPRFSCSTTT